LPHRETQRDTERHRETQGDVERHRETQGDAESSTVICGPIQNVIVSDHATLKLTIYRSIAQTLPYADELAISLRRVQ